MASPPIPPASASPTPDPTPQSPAPALPALFKSVEAGEGVARGHAFKGGTGTSFDVHVDVPLLQSPMFVFTSDSGGLLTPTSSTAARLSFSLRGSAMGYMGSANLASGDTVSEEMVATTAGGVLSIEINPSWASAVGWRVWDWKSRLQTPLFALSLSAEAGAGVGQIARNASAGPNQAFAGYVGPVLSAAAQLSWTPLGDNRFAAGLDAVLRTFGTTGTAGTAGASSYPSSGPLSPRKLGAESLSFGFHLMWR